MNIFRMHRSPLSVLYIIENCFLALSKGMESAAGAFTGTRDSWLLQDSIEDLSSLHPVVAANCLDTTRPFNDFHVTAHYKLSALLLLLLFVVRETDALDSHICA